MGTETPQRPRKEAAGSRHEPGLVRQTAPASTDPIGPQTQTLLEEVLRRENLRTALTPDFRFGCSTVSLEPVAAP